MIMYADVNNALIDSCKRVMNEYGSVVNVRGFETRELLFHSFIVMSPQRRFISIFERNANPFAQIAETVWMLAGRNDLEWLSYYIPQAYKYSDDGKTWRGAYGPRLRNWNCCEDDGLHYGLDQIDEVRKKLIKDPETRQAIITIWDPSLDWVESKDIPCNNWLQFIIRGGRLHLNVVVRSNDIIWGFSHVDFFAWSVLLEAMAYWTNTEVGSICWNVTSFHVYKRHYDLAKIISNKFSHDYPVPVRYLRNFNTSCEDFDSKLEACMNYGGSDHPLCTDCSFDLSDLLSYFTYMIAMYRHHKIGNRNVVTDMLNQMPECDMKLAAIMWLYTNTDDKDAFLDVLLLTTDEWMLLRSFGLKVTKTI